MSEKCIYDKTKICPFKVDCENNGCKHVNNCKHTDVTIVTIEAIINCEKTALQCDYCGEILEHKTDCR